MTTSNEMSIADKQQLCKDLICVCLQDPGMIESVIDYYVYLLDDIERHAIRKDLDDNYSTLFWFLKMNLLVQLIDQNCNNGDQMLTLLDALSCATYDLDTIPNGNVVINNYSNSGDEV